MASVKRKRSDLEDDFKNEVKYPDIRIYILPQRIQKTRIDILKKAARKKGFIIEDNFRLDGVLAPAKFYSQSTSKPLYKHNNVDREN